jgi:hypothetical protein
MKKEPNQRPERTTQLAAPAISPNFLLMSTAEIQKMTTSERLAAMEQLWDALCHEEAELVSPAWHEAVLAKRREKMNSVEARFFTLDQIRDQFR